MSVLIGEGGEFAVISFGGGSMNLVATEQELINSMKTEN